MDYLLRFIMVAILTFTLIACASTRGEKIIYKSDKRFSPYKGKVKVYWKDHGIPGNPNSYTFIATIKAQSFWAGIRPGKFNEKLHELIINKTAEVGGNAVLLYCPEIGTVGQEYCYGDAIKIR